MTLLLTLVSIILFADCTQRLIDFTVISSKNVSMKIPDDGIGERIEGEHYVFTFLGIPFGFPNIKSAVDDAIENAGPGYDALMDGVIYYTQSLFKNGYRVVGTPINTSKLTQALNEKGIDVDKYIERALYHSTTKIDNAASIEKIGILKNKPH